MRKIRGFLLKHRVTTLFRCFFRRKRSSSSYRRLDPPPSFPAKYVSKLLSWGHHFKAKAKAIIFSDDQSVKWFSPRYIRIGQEPVEEKPATVPKGQTAVYVGRKDGDFRRVLVPVIYFNHPLFGELLREAEEEYGFDHPGGITIPCRISEFENVQTRIQTGQDCRRLPTLKLPKLMVHALS